jgi:hypothetical protein
MGAELHVVYVCQYADIKPLFKKAVQYLSLIRVVFFPPHVRRKVLFVFI